jgi:hypothetical protein
MKLEDLTVESIAQMTKEQKETFVTTFVKKWPHLASDIAAAIGFELQVDEMKEEKI